MLNELYKTLVSQMNSIFAPTNPRKHNNRYDVRSISCREMKLIQIIMDFSFISYWLFYRDYIFDRFTVIILFYTLLYVNKKICLGYSLHSKNCINPIIFNSNTFFKKVILVFLLNFLLYIYFLIFNLLLRY